MSDTTHTADHSHDHGHGDVNMVKLIWTTFWILLAITVVEVAFALAYIKMDDAEHSHKLYINFFFIAASIAKAYFIVKTFMHMRFEVKNLVVTVLIPLVFLIYGVIMLLWEGSSWQHMRLVH